MGTTLYVGNLSFEATEQDLRQLFARFGKVESAAVITEAGTGRPRGFGFVVMAGAENAQRAISFLGSTAFMGRTIVVSEALPRPPRKGAGGDRRESGPGQHTTHSRQTTCAGPRKEGDTALGSKSLRKRR